jgi:DNA-binding transcriptional MerR regulator
MARETVQLPENKKYFRIGEISRLVGVEPYVLRYWENEFPQIKPSRADSNQRTYQRKDVELILEIKNLLYNERMTIEGAKKRLKRKRQEQKTDKKEVLSEMKKELQDILVLLSS